MVIAVREQIVKRVVKSGNGGAVWVPRNWLGQEVVVILPEKPKLDVKEKIIHLLEPYLKDIMAVAIYGSYARKEQTKESDVDVLVITNDKNLKLDFKKENLDIMSFTLDRLKKAVEKYPANYYQIVQEAEPLINSQVFEELKEIRASNEGIKNYLRDTKEHLKSNKEFVELDKLDGNYVESYSALYSLMLRLRGLFIIKCILSNDKFSNEKFKRWTTDKKLTVDEFEDSYKVYRLIRDNKNAKDLKINVDVAEKLLNILEDEVEILEQHGK